jgi:uncharacterized membrane protein
MFELMQTSIAQVILPVAVLLVLLAGAGFVVRKFRGRINQDHASAEDLLTNFRQMHHEGDISDAEFREIKAVLGEQLQNELKDAGDKS